MMKNEKIRKYKRKWCAKNKDKVHRYNQKAYWKNPEKWKKQARLNYVKSKEKTLDRIRLAKYGISGDEFRKRLKKQKGRCPICKYILEKNPSVDHNHLTGEIRGLICNQCNLAIGNAGDSPGRLRAMAKYLEENG